MLPFGTIQIVQNTQAFWTTLFGFFINNEEFLKIELIGIVACFCGVLLMASADPSGATEVSEVSDMGRMLGFILMCITAANDGMVGVLARRMSTLHFSVMMFWFAALGLSFTSLTILTKALMTRALPTIMSYSYA